MVSVVAKSVIRLVGRLIQDGNTDIDGLRNAIAEAKACTNKPTFIKVGLLVFHVSAVDADFEGARSLYYHLFVCSHVVLES